MSRHFAVCVTGALCIWANASALVSAQIITDGKVGPAVDLGGPDYAITADLGTLAGDNLFHSFDTFSIGTGETATFSGPDSVDNVISRVTGGTVSDIDGVLRSTILDADVFLINPAGIIFGPNASLDVQGSFSASTADEVTFPDGGNFSASDPGGSVLSVAPPEAFGFLGPSPGAILVDRSDLEVPQFASLSLIGGDISIRGEGGDLADVPIDEARNLLSAQSGALNLIAVGSEGEVHLGEPLDLSAFDELGSIRTDDVYFFLNGYPADATPSGSLQIEGGQIVINNTRIESRSYGSQDGGGITIRGEDVTITADRERGVGIPHQTVLVTDAREAGRGGDINFVGDTITFERGVGVFAVNRDTGLGGDILITGRDVSIKSSSTIGSDTFGSGAGGDVTVNAENLFMLSAEGVRYTGLYTDVYNSGPGGALTVDATTIFLDGTPFFDQPPDPRPNRAAIQTFGSGGPSATGRGGDVIVTADSIRLVGAAEIGSRGGHSGQGGDVFVTSPVIDVLDGAAITAFQRGPGPGGSILISTGALTVGATGQFSLETVGLSGISATTAPGGPEIETPAVSGDLTIFADTIDILPGSDFRSIVRREGTGGDITFIATERITVTGDGTVLIPEEVFTPPQDLLGVTFIAASAESGGAAGNISLTAPLIIVDAGAAIATNTAGSGPGGTVALNADTLIISGGALVDAGTDGSGPGGDILIDASASVLLTGESTALLVESISTEPNAGLAGDIFVGTHTLRIEDGARISTNSAVADGGNITIDAVELFYVSSSSITTSVGDGTGGGGNILIDPVFVVLDDALIQANAFGGPGGNITIIAENFLASPDTIISASSAQSIDVTITIEAPETDLSGAVALLSEELLDAAERLAAQCSARGGQARATFIGRGRSGLPAQPGDPIIAQYGEAAGGAVTAMLPGRLEITCEV
jgi:filamentous hemagglutinin family protein